MIAWTRLLAALVLCTWLWVPNALAQDDAAPLDVLLRPQDEEVEVNFDVTGAFTEDFRRRFVGGITSRVRIRMFLLDTLRREIASAERKCEMRFDVWEELIQLKVQDGSTASRQWLRVVDEAFRACGQVSIILGEQDDYLRRPAPRLIVEVALNPVSDELLERTREFMSNPRGGGGGRSIFSAIARLFRSNKSAGGEVFLFASSPLQGVP
ncbi:MAG: hypothetical protein ACFB9M_15365 [Myxococcota bacterium]